MSMSEQQYLAVVGKIMQDETPIMPIIKIKEAWLLISGLQLATRHPGISPMMKRALEHIARQFQAQIVEDYPEAAVLLEMGWDEANDVGA